MTDVKYTVFEISNGLRVLHVPTQKFNSSFVMLMGKAGWRAETDEEIGAAHFFEHLMFDGTTKRPGAFEINKFVEELGAEKNGMTYSDWVKYYVRILPDKVESAFEYISDIVLNSLLREEDINKEKKVISQEALMKKDNPNDYIGRMHKSHLYPGQSIGRNIFEQAAVIENVNKTMLLGFMQRNYVAKNFVLVVVGDFAQEKTRDMAEKYFAKMARGQEVEYPTPKIQTGEKIYLENRSQKQANFCMSFPGYSFLANDMWKARMLAIIMGGGFSSRLYERIRNKNHLVYSIGVANVSHPDTGVWTISTKTEEDKLQLAIDGIADEITKMKQEGPREWEIEKGKNRLLSWFMFQMENIDFYADYFAEDVLFNSPVTSIKETLNYINGITTKDVHSIAQEVFSFRPVVTLVTPKLTSVTLSS